MNLVQEDIHGVLAKTLISMAVIFLAGLRNFSPRARAKNRLLMS